MNYRKIGPSLSSHLNDYREEELIPVWIRVEYPLAESEQYFLAGYGVAYDEQEKGLISARLTRQQIDALSEEGDWLQFINWGGDRARLLMRSPRLAR